MKRNDLVHTPAGWGMVDQPVTVETSDGEYVEWWAITLLEGNGDAPKPRLFRREELEPAVEVTDA